MTKISENILKTIEAQHVKPEPKWKFLAKDGFVWVAFVALLLVVALAFAVILDFVANYDWDIYTYLHKTFLQHVFFSLPYVWIVLVALFLGLAYYDFVHIKGWYRYRVFLVFVVALLASAGLGTAFFFAGFGGEIDSSLDEKVPLYKASMANPAEIWNHPDEGLLEGKIVKIEGKDQFVLQDAAGKYWNIQDGDSDEDDRNFVEGEMVRIIGDRQADDSFKAKNIREEGKRKGKVEALKKAVATKIDQSKNAQVADTKDKNDSKGSSDEDRDNNGYGKEDGAKDGD